MPSDYGGYVLAINYTVSGLQHVSRIPVQLAGVIALGTPFDEIITQAKNGSTSYLDFVVDALVTKMRPLYGTADDLSNATLFLKEVGSDALEYVSEYSMSVAGSGAAGNPTAQAIFTFRTVNGHIAKFNLSEPNVSSNAMLRPPYPAGALNDLALHIADPSRPFQGTDNSFLYSSIGIGLGQNERLWRKRFRPT